MSTTEKIKIVKIGRKQMPSKFKPGDMYNITTIMDDKGRKLSAFGAWADTWQVGSEVEGIIVEKKWTDKDGFEQISLNIDNPNKKTFVPGKGGYGQNPTITAYQIAADLAPLLYAGKNVKLADIDALVDELKKRFDIPAPATEDDSSNTATTPVKEVDVDAEDGIEADDDKPF